MILVLCGTREGRRLVRALSNATYQVIASAVTAYGAELLNNAGAVEIIARPLNEDDLITLMRCRQVQILVDATHPFAEQASVNAYRACENTGTLYIRFERPPARRPKHSLIHPATDYEHAAQIAVNIAAQNIFLTTGTKTLPLFMAKAKEANKKVIARIIPAVDSLTSCLKHGLKPNQIIAQLGPYSYAMNYTWFQEFKADVLVTKDSGTQGGVETKINAALDLNIPVVIIQRPLQFTSAVHDLEQLMQHIRNEKGSVLIE